MMQGDDAVSIAYFGDGATSTADFHGAANFAAIHHIPIVFCCHNNGVAVSTPLAAQTAVPIYQKARASPTLPQSTTRAVSLSWRSAG
jgi:TPP-dependent pyruvate/acetoin dehydrogenase alpha subunit